jgi:hypothetical protein
MRDLQYMIDVMTAAREGKRIQVKTYNGEWADMPIVSNISWNWGLEGCDWRIAPEPRKAREWWLIEENNHIEIYSCQQMRADGSGPLHNQTHVREVLPEDGATDRKEPRS